jgi:uncharacterized protein YceH (UPF0502 family)
VNILLNEIETRVLGALIEKEITTPEYYPLSLNALLNACNQKSNREPVMNLDEDAVRHALRSLSDQTLARSAGGDSRVAKYEHRLNETFNFHRHEIAILCVLLLRGPQTPGELRTRTERMYHFEDLDTVQSALQLLMKREPPLAKILPRQPGTKEARYTQLLSADAHAPSVDTRSRSAEVQAHNNAPPSHSASAAVTNSAAVDRLAALEDEVASLKTDVSDLKQQLAQFRKQFE